MNSEPERLMDEYGGDEFLGDLFNDLSPAELSLPSHVRSAVQKNLLAAAQGGAAAGLSGALNMGGVTVAAKWTALALVGVGLAAAASQFGSALPAEPAPLERRQPLKALEVAPQEATLPKEVMAPAHPGSLGDTAGVELRKEAARASAPAAPKTRASKPGDTLAQELALLKAARAELMNRPGQCLLILDSYEATFADGQLKAEAARLRARAFLQNRSIADEEMLPLETKKKRARSPTPSL